MLRINNSFLIELGNAIGKLYDFRKSKTTFPMYFNFKKYDKTFGRPPMVGIILRLAFKH